MKSTLVHTPSIHIFTQGEAAAALARCCPALRRCLLRAASAAAARAVETELTMVRPGLPLPPPALTGTAPALLAEAAAAAKRRRVVAAVVAAARL